LKHSIVISDSKYVQAVVYGDRTGWESPRGSLTVFLTKDKRGTTAAALEHPKSPKLNLDVEETMRILRRQCCLGSWWKEEKHRSGEVASDDEFKTC